MEAVKKNLLYVKQALETGTHKEQSAIIHLMLEDVILSVQENVFKYEIPYVMDKDTYHFNVFVERSRKAKASILCDLHELQVYMSKGIYEKRCVVIIDKLFANNFHQNEIHQSISRWKNLAPKFQIQKKKMTIK